MDFVSGGRAATSVDTHAVTARATTRATHAAVMLRRWLLLPLAAPLLIRADDKPYGEGPIIGVDLGTTYSCVAIYKAGNVEIIVNDQGNRVTPSYVAFTETERLVGDAAKTQAALNPENTVYDTKRLIGRKFTDATVQEDMKMCLAALCTQHAPSRAQPQSRTVPQLVRAVRDPTPRHARLDAGGRLRWWRRRGGRASRPSRCDPRESSRR